MSIIINVSSIIIEALKEISIYELGVTLIPITLHNIQTGRYFATFDGKIIDKNLHVVTQFMSNTGYYRVSLFLNEYKNNRRVAKKFLVHRLIAECFCFNDNPKIKNQVDHIDGHKDHNWATNLQWVSQSKNILNAYDMNLCSTKGTSCHFHNPKYTDEVVHEICKCLEKQMCYRDIIIQLNLCDISDRSEYQLWRKYLKNIKGRRCRRDITSQYNY